MPTCLAPSSDLINLGEESVTPRELLLGGVLKVGKASLRDRLGSDGRCRIVSGSGRRRCSRAEE
jgi:hypothetical protein